MAVSFAFGVGEIGYSPFMLGSSLDHFGRKGLAGGGAGGAGRLAAHAPQPGTHLSPPARQPLMTPPPEEGAQK